MTVNLNHLNLKNLTIAAPCTADWNAMTGDDRVRHCPQCKLNVYNLSELSRPQAEQLLKEKEGKLCVRYFQRHDGTILTQNCPAALRRAQQVVQRMVAAIAGLFGLVLTSGTGCIMGTPTQGRLVNDAGSAKRQQQMYGARHGAVGAAPTMQAQQPTTQRDNGTEVLSPEPAPTPLHQP